MGCREKISEGGVIACMFGMVCCPCAKCYISIETLVPMYIFKFLMAWRFLLPASLCYRHLIALSTYIRLKYIIVVTKLCDKCAQHVCTCVQCTCAMYPSSSAVTSHVPCTCTCMSCYYWACVGEQCLLAFY